MGLCYDTQCTTVMGCCTFRAASTQVMQPTVHVSLILKLLPAFKNSVFPKGFLKSGCLATCSCSSHPHYLTMPQSRIAVRLCVIKKMSYNNNNKSTNTNHDIVDLISYLPLTQVG